MKTWLSAVEPELAEDLNKVESARDTPFPMADFTPRTKERSMKFYSILASYTKNKPLRVIKSMTDYNGLEAWRNLIQEHEPYTRGRGLALLNKVFNHKFDNKKTHLENLVAFEEAIENYETAANDVMSDDVKVSVVMNNMEGAVRQHLLLTVDSKTKFENIRQFLVIYEQTVRWTTTDLINSGKDHGGQADMDVSRVKGKGKDKGSKGFKGKGKWRTKGKGKDGKGKWSENGFYKGRGRGFLKGRGRGGRKGKGRSFSSNKGKGRGKGNVLAGVCHYCGKPGHYESQCRKKERDLGGVREVQEEDEKSSAGASSAAASIATTMRTANSSSSAAQAKASAAGTRSVRQIAMYHMAEPEEDSKLFHLDEGEEEDDDYTVDYFGRVVRIEEFSLCDSDSDCISACEESACDGQQQEGDDPVMSWWMSEESAIRAVQKVENVYLEDHLRIEVILDSGADVSLLPLHLAPGRATSSKKNNARLQDAQGNKITCAGKQMVSLILFDGEGGPVCVQEELIIADVVNPLLAVGKLIRAGWEVKTEQGTILTDGESMTPVHFHKNSLATYAFIPELQQEHMNGNMVKNSSRQSVRTVIQLNSFVKKCLEDGVGWRNAEGIPGIVHFCMKQMSYLDPSPMFSGMYFPYRTTVIKDGDTWKAIEVSKKYLDRREPFEAFENEVDELITFVSPKPVTLSVIGFPVEQSERAEFENQTQDYWSMNGLELTRHHVSPRVHKFLPEGVRGFPTSLRNLNSTRKTMGEAYFGKEVFVVRHEWMDEDPYQEPFSQAWTGKTVFTMIEKEGGELQVQEPQKKKKPTIPLEPVREDEEMVDPQEGIIPEELVVEHEGYIYDENCTLHDLRALCKNFGVRTFGSKKQILKRLSSHMQSEDRKQKVEEMSKKYEDAIEPVLRPRNLPPDDPREIELRNLTHLPYAPWCGHCVAMKAKESPFRLQEQKGNADSSKPTVSFDFCFTATATSEEPPATCLVVVDDWTKAVLAVPVSAKGGPTMMKHMKEAVVQFCSQIGYTNMNFRGDNESAAKSLKDSVQKARGVMGLGTILQDTKSYIHQSNGLAERTVQTTRRQANTFLDELREKTKLDIPHTHPIFGWAFRHAAWVLNRFSKIASLGNRTPRELVTGKPYKGEMVNFDAVIYVKRLHPKKKK